MGRFRLAMLGATKAELDSLQLSTYTVEEDADSEDSKCIICFEEYQVSDTLRNLRCGHFFHKHCVDQWLIQRKTCPYHYLFIQQCEIFYRFTSLKESYKFGIAFIHHVYVTGTGMRLLQGSNLVSKRKCDQI